MSPKLMKTLQVELDVNEATVGELMSLSGVGPKTAKRIVSFRKKRGPFNALEGLLEIKGIGSSTLARLRRRLTCLQRTHRTEPITPSGQSERY